MQGRIYRALYNIRAMYHVVDHEDWWNSRYYEQLNIYPPLHPERHLEIAAGTKLLFKRFFIYYAILLDETGKEVVIRSTDFHDLTEVIKNEPTP